MKLVDILARELTAWPETTRLAQDSNGHVFGWTGFPNWDCDQWLIDVGASLDKCRPGEMDLADDHMTSSVTRVEWQAAVDALNADKCEHSYANKIGCPECGELNAPKVVEWDGVGLPPVGTVCEYEARPSGKGEPLFVTVEVKYVSDQSIVIICTDVPDGENKENIGVELALMNGIAMRGKFRAIRTAEQVAAEEREKAVFEIAHILIDNRHESAEYHQAGRIYDAGYRKQVAK